MPIRLYIRDPITGERVLLLPAAGAVEAGAEAGSAKSCSDDSRALFRSQAKGYVWTDGCEPGPKNIERVLRLVPIFEDRGRSFYDPGPGGSIAIGPKVPQRSVM
jgi:hypothetical protein